MAYDNDDWSEINAASARRLDEEERSARRAGLTSEERERYGVPTPPADDSSVTDKARADAAEDRANAERVGFTVDDAAASRGEANAISRAEAAAMALGGIKGVGAAGRMVRGAGAKASPAQWGIDEWQGIAASPQAEWDGVLKAQEDAAAEQARLDRIGRSDAMVQQLIGAKTERVNARNAAKQQADDEFSALAAMCYVPGQDPFVDTDTLTQYNNNHPGNPITKMGRLSGGGLFVERAVMGDDGKPVMEAVFARGEDGKPVMRNGQPVITGEKPKTAIEVIVPEQFKGRMKDFLGWEWDDVTKQFMSGAQYAKVMEERRIQAWKNSSPQNYIALTEQERKNRQTDIDAALAAGKLAAEGGKGGGTLKFIDDATKVRGEIEKLEDSPFKTLISKFLDDAVSQLSPPQGPSTTDKIESATAPTPPKPAAQTTAANPKPLGKKAPTAPNSDSRRAALARIEGMGDNAPTYSFTAQDGTEKTASFSDAMKMADGGDANAQAWVRSVIDGEAAKPASGTNPPAQPTSSSQVLESDKGLSTGKRVQKNLSRQAFANQLRAYISDVEGQIRMFRQQGENARADELESGLTKDRERLQRVDGMTDRALLERAHKLQSELNIAQHEVDRINPNIDQPGEITRKKERLAKAKADYQKFYNGK